MKKAQAPYTPLLPPLLSSERAAPLVKADINVCLCVWGDEGGGAVDLR